MANTIKKGESLFIPFKNGESIYDSQLKPRIYKTKEQYDRFSYHFKDAEMVEYTEVVHAEWLDGYAVDSNGKKVYDSIDCSHCEEVFKIESETREYWKERFKVCPFCGSVMYGGNEDG